MTERTHIGAGDDKTIASTGVEKALAKLANRQTFEALSASVRQEVMRAVLVLLLRIVARQLLK